MWIAIIAGFLLFMFLVIVHELGHFIAAKKSGVKVLEFGLGIPPKAFKIYTDKSGTEYTINRLPLGGFVRLKGEDPDDEGSFYAKDSFITQSLGKKLLILFGGVLVNLFFAWLFFSVAFWKGIQPIGIIPDGEIGINTNSYLMPDYTFVKENNLFEGGIESIQLEVFLATGTIAEEVGIQDNDIILSINGEDINLLKFSPHYFKKDSHINYFKKEGLCNKNISMQILRDGNIIDYSDININNELCQFGIYPIPSIRGEEFIDKLQVVQMGFIEGSIAGVSEIFSQTRITFHVLGNIGQKLLTFDGKQAKEAVENLSGPVGAVKVGEMILSNSIWQYIAFGGIISLALAIFNILPFPALDGGRAVGVIIQSIGKFHPEKYFVIENYFNIVFFVLLMSLGVYIIFLDLARFWGVNPFNITV
ncbi:M50 family metallopeptidase [Candidatus Vampirococcus lugosii]|uniref:Peptidase M50 n=1 Tax=Candidatus Vampirococcus lugosii TaxID=2789015 RepID=A0ABS5QKF4_9BACT|nr:site-2 protease family protein [Candidatus Vampirococcus lugosii]MBS8121727.1 peptidase M50 [Candidatus Vampirococcus lugosii]